jgi:hypothetical protein
MSFWGGLKRDEKGKISTTTKQYNYALKGQSHEKVYEFFTWDGSFSLN